MKRIIITTGIILLIANILFGFIVARYHLFNVCLTSVVILATAALLFILRGGKIREAFVISLSFLFLLIGLVEFILGCVAPSEIENNWYLLVVIILLAFEGIMIAITKAVSHNKCK